MDDDTDLVNRLRAGDESAFVALIERYQQRMLRLAEMTVGSRAVAEEVTQETWLAVVRGVERFEGAKPGELTHALASLNNMHRIPRLQRHDRGGVD